MSYIFCNSKKQNNKISTRVGNSFKIKFDALRLFEKSWQYIEKYFIERFQDFSEIFPFIQFKSNVYAKLFILVSISLYCIFSMNMTCIIGHVRSVTLRISIKNAQNTK